MRILQILPELNVGGVETGVVDFARYLKDHEVYNIVVSNGGAMVKDLEKIGVKHYRLPVHNKSLWMFPRCIGALRKIIIDEKIEIVHARSRVPAWIAYFACRKTDAEFITTCHGHYGVHFFSSIMGWGKRVIVPSEVIGRHMIENFNVPPERVRCIPRSVDLARFKMKPEDPAGRTHLTISIVGRLTPLKGHTYFLKAMAKVARSMPFIRVWVIGDAPARKEVYKNELLAQVRHLGLTQTVEFMENRRDVPDLLAQTDVLVMSSVEPESFGRVILEAQAVGVPVVATKVGGVVEIIEDEKTGLLVYPKDPDAMAQAVLRLLHDKGLGRRLAGAAREKLEMKYTVAQMSSATLKVYEEILGRLSILVIKISSLGDVVLVTAALKALREKYPRARIHCLVGKESREVLQRCLFIDELIVIDIRHRDRSFFRFLKFARRLRKRGFDKIVDFQNNLVSHLLVFLSFPRDSYGYNTGKKKLGFLIQHPVKDPDHLLPPVPHQFQVLKLLGISYDPERYLELWPSENDRQHVGRMLDEEWIGQAQQIVGINLSASERWPTKNWPLESIARLCDLLAGRNIRVLITGTEKDMEAARQLKTLTKVRPSVFVGRTKMMELAVLIERCRVFITPDSAPMHIAAAMRVPFIVFFGPTSSRRHLPPAESFAVIERRLECRPCYGTTCRIQTHKCMRDISPEEVLKHVEELMRNTQ